MSMTFVEKSAQLFALAHPFLFAILPSLATLIEVKKLVLPEEILPGLALCELFALLSYGMAWLFCRNLCKAALIASAALAYCFTYRSTDFALNTIFSQGGASVPPWIVLSVFVLMGALIAPSLVKDDVSLAGWKLKVDHREIGTTLSRVACILLLVNAVQLTAYEMNLEELASKLSKELDVRLVNLDLPKATAAMPDIYYVILDGFANSDALTQSFGLTDHTLDNFLRSKQFFVVPRAKSNYDRTELSLTSAFSMEHLDSIPESESKKFDDMNVFGRLIDRSTLFRVLKKSGYKIFVVTASTSEHFYVADRTIHCAFINDFALALLGLTPFYGTETYFHTIRNALANGRLEVLRRVGDISSIPGPKFVFVHTELPHAPCLFDAKGGLRPLPKGSYMTNWGTPKEYFDQWVYTEGVVSKWVDNLQQQTKGKAVIIVQSDHGSGIPFAKPHDWYNERMKILNAYYLPDVKNRGLYETITPINSFRVVLNDYFDTKLPMNPDRSVCAPDFSRTFEWVDVADEMEYRVPSESTKR
jgi:hypothetical protein